MRIWGKLLGFLFGFMLTKNPFGGLIGMWIGHTFDRGRSLNFDHLGQHSDEERQAEFLYCTFSSMGFVAKADGQVAPEEIAFASAYMDKLGLTGTIREHAQAAFRKGKMADFPLESALSAFKRNCINRKDLLLLFMEIQIQLAFADGQLDQYERKALHRIARVLGFSAIELDQLLEMIIAGAQFHQQGQHQQSGQANNPKLLDNAYKLLGVSPQSSDKEIKKAYRKLMSQHHPDKLVAKGLPPEMMDVAKQKTQDIQAAYEMISSKRG